MSRALQNKIKTYSTLYSCEEENGELPNELVLHPMRISENGVAGNAEEISSDIILPETRIPSTPEVGTESNSGDIQTEWNIDEQDEWLAAVFCNNWKVDSENKNKKILTLGDVNKSFSFFEKFPQTPVAWQHYKNEYVNQLTMDFQTDSFVKLTWSWMGGNNPRKKTEFPIDTTPVIAPALKTKSFLTKSGMWLKIGETVEDLKPLRQAPSMSITFNNNIERTPALGEEESIENSLGDFIVSGTLDVYDADDTGHSLYNAAADGSDRIIQVLVSRKVGAVTTSYCITLDCHLGVPTKSRNGNKYQFSIPFQVNSDENLSLVKEVIDSTLPSVPVFAEKLTDVSYNVGDSAASLNGEATVTDGGVITYQWLKDGVDFAVSESIVPDTSVAGSFVYTVKAINTKNEKSTIATQKVTVTVNGV